MTRQLLEVKSKLDKARLYEALEYFPSLPLIPVTCNGLSPYIGPGWEQFWWNWPQKSGLPPEFWFSRSVSTLCHWTRGTDAKRQAGLSAVIKLDAVDSVGSQAQPHLEDGAVYRQVRPAGQDSNLDAPSKATREVSDCTPF